MGLINQSDKRWGGGGGKHIHVQKYENISLRTLKPGKFMYVLLRHRNVDSRLLSVYDVISTGGGAVAREGTNVSQRRCECPPRGDVVRELAAMQCPSVSLSPFSHERNTTAICLRPSSLSLSLCTLEILFLTFLITFCLLLPLFYFFLI